MFYHAVMAPNILQVLDSFEGAMDAGVLRRADPKVAVGHFLKMCLGWTLRRVIRNIQQTPTDAQIEKNVRDAVSAFMDGYTPRPQPPSKRK